MRNVSVYPLRHSSPATKNGSSRFSVVNHSPFVLVSDSRPLHVVATAAIPGEPKKLTCISSRTFLHV
jgi:hypothetical protein